ncbi:MAG: Gmad2 immunoglobulin-like domain-containing protein [Candidatus Paceibacterota bacterium]
MKNLNKGFVIPIIIIIVAIFIIGSGIYFYKSNQKTDDIVACTMDAMECPDGSWVGRTGPNCEFVCPASQNDMILVNQPVANAVVSNPFIINGEARGGWYFEGSFPLRIEDANGNILGQHYATAKGEWMTDEYVPFTSELSFKNPSTETGFLILSKDNPSDLREFDDEIKIPIRFDVDSNAELMDLSLYIQDKSYVETSSCSVTKKVVYKVPKTTAVADTSLQMLFDDELSAYGTYKSVSIVNGVAKVLLASDMTPSGYPISALSSCQSSHLLAVLKDTLTQYSSIKSVELLSSEGAIQF